MFRTMWEISGIVNFHSVSYLGTASKVIGVILRAVRGLSYYSLLSFFLTELRMVFKIMH